jgi:transcriptional regulator of met regulon
MVCEQDSHIIVNTTMRDEEERQRTVVYWPHAHNTELVCETIDIHIVICTTSLPVDSLLSHF